MNASETTVELKELVKPVHIETAAEGDEVQRSFTSAVPLSSIQPNDSRTDVNWGKMDENELTAMEAISEKLTLEFWSVPVVHWP